MPPWPKSIVEDVAAECTDAGQMYEP